MKKQELIYQQEKRKKFIHALAEFLGGTNQVRMSIALQVGGMAGETAQHWKALRNFSPLFGYPSVEEAEEQLTEFLK